MKPSELVGLVRSLAIYWRPGRQPGLRRLYAPFVQSGDLVFDVGAHLGDRSAAFAGLGARVVAFEPQPLVARWLRRIAARRGGIEVRTEAVGATAGTAALAISRSTPTVSTLSERWRASMGAVHPGFRGVRWEDSVEVEVVTLDALVAEYGVPAFCKIDVEGHEPEVLRGLNRALPALSVEFVAGQLDSAEACVRRLEELGPYRFNAVLGEKRAFALPKWVGAEEMLSWFRAGASGASSGDLYACLEPPTGGGVGESEG